MQKYQVLRTVKHVKLNGDWDSGIWTGVKAIKIKHYMGTEPEHKPKTQAKIVYDDKFIYVNFRVEDNYIRSVAQNYNDNVSQDSCVEFFFSPGPNIEIGYFNIEINCGGVMLFHYHRSAGTKAISVSNSACDKIEIFHSEPRIVEPEKQEPTVWFIQYRVPIDILEKYCLVTRPAPGIFWRSNFYKCANDTSHPHWLTWSIVDYPIPKFHLPKFFGLLEFK